MAHSTTNGSNYRVTDKSLIVFGMAAEPLSRRWMLGVLLNDDGEYVNVEGDPEPVLDEIIKVIDTDRENGDYSKIAAVVVSNRIAGRLFCERVLTKANFENAMEGAITAQVKDEGEKEIPYIVLPQVTLGAHTFPLVIVPLLYVGYNHICTVDSENKIVGENGGVHPLLPEPEVMVKLLPPKT